MPHDSLAEDLHGALGTISGRLRLRFAAGPSPGIGFVGLATLRHLDRHGARTVTELAHADQVTTQAISLRIRPLVDAGLVTRTPDPVDTRRSVVAATEQGRAVVATAESRAREALQAAVERLSVAERHALSDALRPLLQVAANLSEES